MSHTNGCPNPNCYVAGPHLHPRTTHAPSVRDYADEIAERIAPSIDDFPMVSHGILLAALKVAAREGYLLGLGVNYEPRN